MDNFIDSGLKMASYPQENGKFLDSGQWILSGMFYTVSYKPDIVSNILYIPKNVRPSRRYLIVDLRPTLSKRIYGSTYCGKRKIGGLDYFVCISVQFDGSDRAAGIGTECAIISILTINAGRSCCVQLYCVQLNGGLLDSTPTVSRITVSRIMISVVSIPSGPAKNFAPDLPHIYL